MNIFSYCIYGDDLKYYVGLQENIKIINCYYPTYFIYLYCGTNRLDNYLTEFVTYKNVKLIDTHREGTVNMIYRYMPLTLNIESLIVRDADSEINERDRWCINDFISNNYACQTIRDHYWHKSKLTGGLTQFKNMNIDPVFVIIKNEMNKIYQEIDANTKYNYGSDENTLNNIIYPIIKHDLIVYTNICVYNGDISKRIQFINDGTNFCGNVIEFPRKYTFNYFEYNLIDQLAWLNNQKQHDLILYVIDEYGFNNLDFYKQLEVLCYMIHSWIYKENISECMKIYGLFYKYPITNNIKKTIPLFFELARQTHTIIGTCNLDYIPLPNEIVIYYGNFPDDYMSLPQGNKIYKHVIYYNNCISRFEADSCWDNIDQIFIMGLEHEFDRMNHTIIQLSLMNAPLNKIYEYKAKKSANDIYAEVTKNHLDCLQIMIDNSYNTCLFLEDDFIFCSDFTKNKCKMTEFFKRDYDYNICFLSASKLHIREDYDDLLIISKQLCTTSSGYFINKSKVIHIYNTIKEGYELLLTTNNDILYCIDRYWAKLDKLYIFKDKIGFQKPSMSKITGELNINLD